MGDGDGSNRTTADACTELTSAVTPTLDDNDDAKEDEVKTDFTLLAVASDWFAVVMTSNDVSHTTSALCRWRRCHRLETAIEKDRRSPRLVSRSKYSAIFLGAVGAASARNWIVVATTRKLLPVGAGTDVGYGVGQGTGV